MMNDDTLAKARAVVARLAEAESEDYALAAEARDPLIRLAEAVGAIVAGGGPGGPWWWHDEGCVGCGHDGAFPDPHDDACPATAIDAALAELAALDGGEVGE